MTGIGKILAITIPIFCSVIYEAGGQPVWVSGTPSVAPTGPLSITLNYGIDRIGTVYFIVYNYNNTSVLTSSFVRSQSQSGTGGTIVAAGTMGVKKADIGKILQLVLNVTDPDRVHTIYIVAADNKSKLQNSPIRLNVTTPGCPRANGGNGGNECDLNFVLNAIPVFGSGTWSRISGPGTASFSPGSGTPGATVTVSAYGTYIFRWTETKGACSSFADISVTFYRAPVLNAGNGGDECDLGFNLSAADPVSGRGTWSMTSGSGTPSFSPNANSPAATVTVSEYGTKVFTWTVVNGVCLNSSNITVNFYRQPVANPGKGGNNCGTEFYLQAIPSYGAGTWTRVSGPGSAAFTPDANAPAAKVTVTAFGTYVLRWTERNGTCSSYATVSVSFSQEISANAGNGGDECDKDFILSAVPEGGTGTWTKLNGPGSVTFNPDANHPGAKVSVSQFGEYNFAWTEVKNNCSSVDIVKVVFHNPPPVDAGPDLSVCLGNDIQLLVTGSGSFLWSPAKVLNNPAIQNPVAIPDITTVFTVTATDSWGCKNSDQVRVEVKETPVAKAGNDQVLDFIFETYLDAGEPANGETGEWSVLSGTGEFADKNNRSTKVTGLSLDENRFMWNLSNGVCPVSSDTMEITVHNLTVPTLITPNMDGKNDYFVLNGIQSLGRTNLTIFDRWGNRVYSVDNYANNWDGKDNKGFILPNDTYFFVLTSENRKAINGYIVIKR